MPDQKLKNPLQVGMVSIENQSGGVKVMLGVRSYSYSQFNRAVSNNRLPGSSFKPFVYLTAMEKHGYHPASNVLDEPISIEMLFKEKFLHLSINNSLLLIK